MTEQLLTSPDIILFNFLNMGTEDICEDLKFNIDSNTEHNAWLYKLLKNYRIQRYNFYEQAKSIFLRSNEDPKKILVDLTYNKKQNGPVNLFLSLGTENYSQNVLSIDESRQNIEESEEETEDIFSRRLDRTMSLYIYTDNSNETIILYEIYKSLIIAYTNHLELLGIRNIIVSGQDISEYPDFLPKDFFFRVLSIKFNYQTSSCLLKANKLIDCFKIEGKPVLI